uniref:Uncharacterized protein n=1 Tax=Arundo donax TaxID=35708 RepID=A0A0A8YBC4_ARUDO
MNPTETINSSDLKRNLNCVQDIQRARKEAAGGERSQRFIHSRGRSRNSD